MAPLHGPAQPAETPSLIAVHNLDAYAYVLDIEEASRASPLVVLLLAPLAERTSDIPAESVVPILAAT